MERHINTYQGMNKDTAYDSIDPSLYIDALDIRITTTTGESMGAWTNIKGNVEAFTIPSSGTFNGSGWTASNPEIIGYTTIRNRIILFVADDSDAKGWIYDVQYNTATREILPGFPALKYYNGALNFEKNWPIEALGRYETDCIQRVYWTDYNNFFRTVNLEDPDLETLDVGNIDIFPNIAYTQPLLKIVTGGGALLSGEYQVSYRLITTDGKQTLIAPPSILFHIVEDSESLPQSAQYNGNPTQVNTGKSIQIQVDTSGYTNFDKIEFIVAYYANGTATPEVTAVEQISIGTNATITFNYTGTEGSIVPIELFEFIVKSYAFKTPKTITQKDSSLVISNIKGSTVNVQDLLGPGETFDAKTKRFNFNGDDWNTVNPLGPVKSELDLAFNTNYNLDAHWDENWQLTEQFRYQNDGVTLGGNGPNINYKFHLEPFTLDGNNTDKGFANVSNTPDFVFTHNFNDGYGTYENTTYPNFASPFLSGLMRGYKRGETYRFGIVFYTLKGEATYVEYIGDIKFPDISEEDGSTNNSGTTFWPTASIGSDVPGAASPNDTIGFNLGIEFTLDFSTCPLFLNQIESYQIVRVQRQESDKRRYSQGFVKGFWSASIGDKEHDFDLKVSGSGEVLHLYRRYPDVSDPTNLSFSNASFGTLEDQANDPSPYTPVFGIPGEPDYYIKGQYLGFYSPEISYNYGGSQNTMGSLANNPCLLITGGYYNLSENVPLAVDHSAEGLGITDFDSRKTYRSVYPVSYNSIENIKKWANVQVIKMPDTSDYTTKITPSFSDGYSASYYMRNYYATDSYLTTGADLNNPKGGTINKAGTSIIGVLSNIQTDILTGIALPTYSAFNYFKAPYVSYIYVKDPFTGAPNIGISHDAYPLIDYVLPKLEVYGGYNQNALENNIFIQASPVIDKTVLNPIVFGGDTFINMFTVQPQTMEFDTNFYGNGPSNKYTGDDTETAIYPVEASINVDLAYGATIKTGVKYTFSGTELIAFRQETNNTTTTYGKTAKEMYAYNSVNSVENSTVTYFVKPEGAADCLVNDVRTYLSNVKTNGEVIDSWTQFPLNSYYDVDDYGPINKILNWRDTVYFIQDKGIGIFAINRAAITTTLDGVPTQLGIGAGFGKHQYYSKEHGSIHQYGVKATENCIYIFDAISRKFFQLAGAGIKSTNTPISEVKGIHSWLQALPDAVFFRKEDGGDNSILKKGITIGYDKINDEVIFTFLGSGDYELLTINTEYTQGTVVYIPETDTYFLVTDTFTTGENPAGLFFELAANADVKTQEELNLEDDSIVLDDLMQQFSSRYSATPKMWVENSDILMSPDPSNPDTVYTHNIGNWGEFYGNTEECSISLVINPQADMNKVLRTIEFNSIVRDDNKVIDRTKTITAFRIQTQYQDTLKTPFSSGRIMRKFDKWRVKIPRDQLSVTKQGRLRSTYFILTLYFDNSDNKELITNRLMSYFDYQMF